MALLASAMGYCLVRLEGYDMVKSDGIVWAHKVCAHGGRMTMTFKVLMIILHLRPTTVTVRLAETGARYLQDFNR